MSTNRRCETARIYQFPVKPRAAARPANAVASQPPAQSLAATDFGSAWYHDAAIKREPSGPHAG